MRLFVLGVVLLACHLLETSGEEALHMDHSSSSSFTFGALSRRLLQFHEEDTGLAGKELICPWLLPCACLAKFVCQAVASLS